MLYPEIVGFTGTAFAEGASAKRIRQNKGELLSRFRSDGYYLIDASSRPMPEGASSSTKARLMRTALPALRAKLERLIPRRESPIILIGAITHAVCFEALRSDGWKVLNESMVDHPARGGQVRFRAKLADALKKLGGKSVGE